MDPPIGHPQPWIAAQPELQPDQSLREDKSSGEGEEADQLACRQQEAEDKRKNCGKGKELGGVKTTPIRTVEAGEFLMEIWIEEGKGKEDFVTGQIREEESKELTPSN